MVRSILLAGVALVLPSFVQCSASYSMVKEYYGSSFFDDWAFYDNYDNLTDGDVEYLSSKTAGEDKLAYINDAGNAIIKVDNTTDVTVGNKRNSIRISTTDYFTVGSLWIVDMLHVPYGCSVWPAFWSSAHDWPEGGEIDTFEGVNQVTMNQMALHTDTGCYKSTSALETSTLINSTNCSISYDSNLGCVVTTPTTSSYGAEFADNGGGMFVTEFAETGIAIWFFNRSSIPDALSSNASTVDVSDLGTPTANYSNDACDIADYFSDQTIVFDITLCGDWAGDQTVFAETCTGVCYDDWVLGDGSNYDTAYFEVQYLRVYGVPGEDTVVDSAAPPTTNMRSSLFWALLAFVAAMFAL